MDLALDDPYQFVMIGQPGSISRARGVGRNSSDEDLEAGYFCFQERSRKMVLTIFLPNLFFWKGTNKSSVELPFSTCPLDLAIVDNFSRLFETNAQFETP